MAAQSTLRQSAAEEAIAAFVDKYAELIRSKLRSTSKTTRLLSALALVTSIILAGEGARRRWKRKRAEREQGRKLVRTNSWLHNKDGSRTIFVPYRDKTAKVVIHGTKRLTFEAHRRLFLSPPKTSGLGDGTVPSAQTKPGVNLAFLHQFGSLLSIMVPRWTSKESALLMGLSAFLMMRTYLSLVVARLDGEIVRDLMAGNGKLFLWGLVKWCGLGGFATYTNSMIKFLEGKVSIAFRTRLTRYIHDLYLNDNLNYYKVHNLDGGVGASTDQFITHDLTRFCAAAANLYSSLGKPFVDICIFNYQLYRSLGPFALTGLLSAYLVSSSVLRKLAPEFAQQKATEGQAEGEFRSLHGRLMANAEEIAFYGGGETEKTFLDGVFESLKGRKDLMYQARARYNMFEDLIVKYGWSAYGYALSSLPVFLPAWSGLGGKLEPASAGKGGREQGRMKNFIFNKRLMLSLADAGTRMIYELKDLSELAGYTSRVYTLISTLHRVHANSYPVKGMGNELYSLSDVQGTMQRGFDGVRLENVPVVAPAIWPMGGSELIESLSMIVRSGDHLLISGPNGVGKSAIARVIAGLWPVYRGLVSRPKPNGEDGIMFLPQRPYLSIGTLRDQVIYPDGAADMREKHRNDRDLQTVLDLTHLGYLPARFEDRWNARKEWKDVLSGGEKQRLAIARLLYHQPKYAFIDEGTSAVSSDVEGLLYETCKQRGITLITISTRVSLKKYHSYSLTLGLGQYGNEWDFQRIGTPSEKMQAERELSELRSRLRQVEDWKARHAQIVHELERVWIEGGDDNVDMPPPPPYMESAELELKVDTEAEETQDEADFHEAQEMMGLETGERNGGADGAGEGSGSGVIV